MKITSLVSLAVVLPLLASAVSAQVSKQTLESISIPDKVETSIGTLEFFDGVPTDATVEALYDNLDRMRGVEVYLDNIGGVSINSVLDGLADAGADAPNRIAVFEQLLDSETLVLTANTSTLYAYSGTDLAKNGPTVIEVPPGMLGFLDDSWQRFGGHLGDVAALFASSRWPPQPDYRRAVMQLPTYHQPPDSGQRASLRLPQ